MTAEAGRSGVATERRPRTRIRIPLWRRITATFSLAFVTVVTGVFIAVFLGGAALLMLFLLERAIST